MKAAEAVARRAVEDIIDTLGVNGLLDAVSDVCHEKAEHLATNWQDHQASARWVAAAVVFQNLKENMTVKGVTR